jgi:hypothetical protein
MKRFFSGVCLISTLTVMVSLLSSATAEEPIGRLSQPLSGVQSSFWPHTNIAVCWDTWNGTDAQARGWVQSAINETWERYSAVRFFGWGSCSGFAQVGEAIRVRVADVNPAVSEIGSALHGVEGGMVLNFTFAAWEPGCAANPADREFCIRAIAVHEFGHALGFTHEDHRSDRFGCTEPHMAQGTSGDYMITAYDLQSVMNYCNPKWNGDGVLSFHDRWGAVAIYGGWSPDFATTPNAAAADMTYLAVAHRNSDELNIFYEGPDRALGTNWSNRNVDGGIWQRPFGITPPGAARADTPIGAVARGKQLHAFYIGPDNALATTWTDGGPWVAAFPITPPSAARGDSPLAATIRGDQLHVFYIGPDGALASTWAAPNVDDGRWQAPFPITPPGTAAPASRLDVTLRKSELHVFFQDGAGAMATAWSAPDVDNGRWQPAFPITPPGAGIAGTAVDAVLRSDQLHLFYQGPDGALATTWAAPNANGGRWHSPFPITPPRAGRANSPIAALARNADKLDVHYIGPDGAVATVWANVQGRWQQPFPVTPPGFARSNTTLAATSRFDRMMDVFYLGHSSEVKTLWENDRAVIRATKQKWFSPVRLEVTSCNPERVNMANLDGTWTYYSFCPRSGTDKSPPQIAAPWAPQGTLAATTDATTGKVTGTLKFAPGVELAISGSITPAAEKLPEGIELTGEGLSSVNKIRGYFIAGSSGPMVVGTVVAVQNDLAKQPVGTSGPFVLFPAAG